jgi:hypothetical protein
VALVQKVEAHFEVWHQQNAHEETADNDPHGGHLGKLANERDRAPDPLEKIRTALRASQDKAPVDDKPEGDAHLKAFSAAFESDAFDAKTLPTGGPANAHIATFGIGRLGSVL